MPIIGIIGSRRRDTIENYEEVKTLFLTIYKEGDIIVSGGCPKGGDRFAELIALELVDTDKVKLPFNTLPIIIYPALWKRYGRGAGFKRNTDIAADANILIACVSEDRTGGTEDTINKFLSMGKKHLFLV